MIFLNIINKISNQKKNISSYVFITIMGYLFVFTCLSILVEHVHFSQSIAYFITYLVWYVLQFFLHIILFGDGFFDWGRVRKYILFISLNIIIQNVFFRILTSDTLNCSYLFSTAAIIIFLSPFRYFLVTNRLYSK